MDTPAQTSLHVHTLESILDDLVAGVSIPLNENGEHFKLNSPHARACCGWYRDQRSRWSKPVTKEDAEEIVERLIKPIPNSGASRPSVSIGTRRVLHLKRIQAHRFGGIHRFGTIAEPPPTFDFSLDKKLLLVEGSNGAGKTSLLSAIMWCLTGYINCPLRPPEQANQSLPVRLTAGETGESHYMAPITPMPPDGVLVGLGSSPIPLDTWVELTFSDENGHEVGAVKRWLQRGPKNSIVVKVSGLSELGLDSLACEISSLMPALLPYIELGESSELGKAVASLIGIKPLQDLAEHAGRCQGKLRKDFVRDRQAEIDGHNSEFDLARRELEEILRHHDSIGHNSAVPTLTSTTLVEDLANWRLHFESLQTTSLTAARDILGESFNPADATAREDLLKNVGPAIGLLDPSRIADLRSARRLSALANLGEQEITAAKELVVALVAEAAVLAEHAQHPEQAARLRLYARVVKWMRDHGDTTHSVDTCPLCQTALAGKIDSITRKPVTHHMQESLESDQHFLEKTIEAWEADALARLRTRVAPVLQSELGQELPQHPADLISVIIRDELFASQPLKGTLGNLKAGAVELCNSVISQVPVFTEPDLPALPANFGKGAQGLSGAIRRLYRAISFATWRKENASHCRQAFFSIIGSADSNNAPAEVAESDTKQEPLLRKLRSLDHQVKTALPVNQSLTKIKSMITAVEQIAKKQKRIDLYRQAADALQELVGISTLVEGQVNYLMRTLGDSTKQWKERLYSPSFIGAPGAMFPDVHPDGTIVAEANANGVQAPAQHIGNASELRATLLAFLIAFWEHIHQTRGGLALLLLDDPQEMFDPANQRRIASVIPLLVKAGALVVTTTLSPEFARQVLTAATREVGQSQIDRRRLYPPKGVRPHVVLGMYAENIDERRRAFEDPTNENDSQIARDYLKDLRIYLENRLCDFFDIPDPNLPKMFTLSDLIAAIRTRHNSGMDAFTSSIFAELVNEPALMHGSEFLTLVNESHHGKHDRIEYADVLRIKEQCVRVRRLVESSHEAYDRWLRRDPAPVAPVIPPTPSTISFPRKSLPVFSSLAAFTSDSSRGSVIESEEKFQLDQLSNHTLYVVACHNFGFSGAMNCRAIVSLDTELVADNRLVIALHKDKIYARRVLRDKDRPDIVMLGSDAIDPTRRVPSIQLPASEVRLLKVTGILFDYRPIYPRPTGEAVLAHDMSILNDVEMAFKVQGKSAEPLALTGQTVLGGRQLTPEELGKKEYPLVAVATQDGESVLKRVGSQVPNARHIRHLEAIGGQGASFLIRTEEIDDDPFHRVPLMQTARLILGVLYESH